MLDLAAGTLLHQRYRTVRPLGKGGMGTVYEAVDTRLQNTVAVKQMTLAGDEANRAFEREAQLLASLRHPALPVVIDFFVEDARQFLVMQYIEGEDLARAVQRLGAPLDADELLRCALALAGALAYLHRREPPIVHRDLKPANVNRTPAGEFVLLDFGLAKGREPTAEASGGERSVYGFTPGYAPPEQIQGLRTDPRSDIFAFGATLYHLAAGAPPPPAVERLSRVAGGARDPLAYRLLAVRGLDVRMQAVIARALALDPAERFQSATEIIAALGGADAAPRPAKAPEVSPAERRVDAALPSQAEVGRPIDLIVQVRFAGSPSLGLEDWPSRRRPDRIEQASEAVNVTYPTDPVSGDKLPARLRIRIVAPDFTVAGAAEQLVDVPPQEYSKRLAFLLTPVRDGTCRVNVEVYGMDAAFLGVIAVEAEALYSAAIAESPLRVANLDLRVTAGQQIAAGENASVPGPELAAGARASGVPASMDTQPSVEPLRTAVRPASAPAMAPDAVPQPSAAAGSTLRKWIPLASAAVVLLAAGVFLLVPQSVQQETAPRSIAPADSTRPPQSVQASPPANPPPAIPPAEQATTAAGSRGRTGSSAGEAVAKAGAPGAPAATPAAPPSATSSAPPKSLPATPAPSPTPPAAAAALPPTISGLLRAIVDSVPPATLVDGTGCSYTLTLEDVEAVIVVNRGSVASGRVTARAIQRARPPCSNADATHDLSYALTTSRPDDAGGIEVLFTSGSPNVLGSRTVQFRGRAVDDGTIGGTLTWIREPGSAGWTAQADAVFRPQ